MSEPNQAKWRGIRPTDPAENIPVTESTPLTEIGIKPVDPPENIPVTESAPLTEIKVQPLAAGTEFKTKTKKRAPATADLQAYESQVMWYDSYNAPGAGNYNRDTDTVPAGKIWYILTFNGMNTSGASGTIGLYVYTGATLNARLEFAINPMQNTLIWARNPVILVEDQFLRVRYTGIAGGDALASTVAGYQVDLY